METSRICDLLDEIGKYFFECYRNASGGTQAAVKFYEYMCAVALAKELIQRHVMEAEQ